MRIDASQSPALFRLASARLGGHYRADWNHKILSAVTAKGIVGQAIFTGISPRRKAELTLWWDGDGSLAGRVFLHTVFDVAFHQWELVRLHAVTRESNNAAQAALQRAGFTFEASLARWFGDEDGWMFYMLRGSCPWLKE